MALTAGKSLADIVSHMIGQLRPPHADGRRCGRRTSRCRRAQGRPLLEQHGAGAFSAEGFDRLAEAVERRRKTMTRLSG